MTQNETKRLPDESLESAVDVYKTTLEACRDLEEDYCHVLDKATIMFLEELKQYRATGLTPEQVRKLQQDCTGRMLLSDEYLAIGTLEECREAVEKMKPKEVQKIQIPNTSWTKAQTRFECPSCHKYLNYRELSHCGLCGQRLLWEE